MRKAKDTATEFAASMRAPSASEPPAPRASSKERPRGGRGASPPCRLDGGVQARSPGADADRLARAPARLGGSPVVLSAVDMLDRAMRASTPRARAIWARRGLAKGERLDRTTQSMLLRQLYLGYYEERRFERAAEIAEQMVHLGVLPDVAHQDAARARQALGDVDAAAGHLRLAARVGPASRRAFHWWTLGSLYHLAHRYDEAISAITRAARWGTTDKPLYQGHLAVVRCERGERVDDLPVLIEQLAGAPAGQGYGRFILGQMAFYDGRPDEARRYLEAFIKRSAGGRVALAIALEGEMGVARQTLAALAKS